MKPQPPSRDVMPEPAACDPRMAAHVPDLGAPARRPLNVALLQMTAQGNDLAANAAKGEAFCRQAAIQGADIALFPEMWSAGYTPHHPGSWQTTWRAAADWPVNPPPKAARPPLGSPWHGLPIDRNGPFIQRFHSLARDLRIAIAITNLER